MYIYMFALHNNCKVFQKIFYSFLTQYFSNIRYVMTICLLVSYSSLIFRGSAWKKYSLQNQCSEDYQVAVSVRYFSIIAGYKAKTLNFFSNLNSNWESRTNKCQDNPIQTEIWSNRWGFVSYILAISSWDKTAVVGEGERYCSAERYDIYTYKKTSAPIGVWMWNFPFF